MIDTRRANCAESAIEQRRDSSVAIRRTLIDEFLNERQETLVVPLDV